MNVRTARGAVMFESNQNEEMVAERLKYSDYTIRRKRNSRIDPSNTTLGERRMECPSCSTEQPEVPHGEIVSCKNGCGLYMRRYGNILQCVEVESIKSAKRFLPS